MEVWKRVNGLKNYPVNNISAVDWKHYFQTLYNPPSPMVKGIQYCMPLILDDQLDSPFTVEDLNKVLNKAKCGKAPGLDGIP